MFPTSDHMGRTPLWICASVSCPWTRETLECLCTLKNIEIDKPDVRDQTPLFAAVKYNHIDNAQLLGRGIEKLLEIFLVKK